MDTGSLAVRRRRALRIALIANGGYVVLQVAGGLAFSSLALLADAAHNLSDVAALGIALLALRLTERPATARHTFGLQRAEVLGAQANALLLLAASGWIVFEAVRRLDSPVEVQGAGMMAVAAGGLGVNIWSAALLATSAGRSLNMRAAYLHLTWDAAGSLAAMAAAAVILLNGAVWVDPAASILIAVLVLWSVWRLLRETTHVLMEGAPRHLDAREIEEFIAADPSVSDVHHLHVWNLASEVPALSAHVVITGERTLHDAQVEGDRLRAKVLERFGIEHTTFELECHGCEEG